MSDWKTVLSQSFKDNPIAESNNLDDSGNDKSIVDVILEAEKDPNIHFEPEDQYGLPKQLNTITKLRKDGWDNSRIFKAMELETAEQDKVRKPGSSLDTPKEKPKQIIKKNKRSLGQKTAEQFRRTATSSKLDQMYFLSFTQSPGSLPLEEVQELIDEYEEMVERDPIEAENWAEYIMNATGGLAGTMAEGLKAGVPYGVAGATGAAIVGSSPPLAPIPEEIVTAPLGFGTGMAIGSTVFWTQQGSGMMLRNMIDRGVDDNTALMLSSLGGLFYGAIEQMQVGRLIPEGVQKEANKAITNGVIKFVKNATDRYGKDWARNIAEEELQLGVEVITTELGAVLEGVETREAKDIWDEAVETAKQTAAGLLPMYGGKAAVNVGVDKGPATIGKIVGSLVDTSKEMELPSKVSKEEALTVESQAQQITNDKANDFNIVYKKENDGSMEISEEELLATGYNIDLNKLPVSREDENGNKFYAVKIKGETDSQGNISINSSADRSTLLEETVESRLKQLQRSKNAEDQALVEQIRIWTDAVRKKASELGLNLRFDESVEGNIELFSDAILYTVGGFKGLSKEFEDTIYIPEALSNEFIAKFGKMSDGSNVFDMLKGSESGVTAKREFQKGVDEEIKFENYIRDSFARPPPAKPTAKSKLQKKTKQMVPGENTKTPSFKNWFGDSKVVDKNNQPLVVYHGTNKDFDEFKLNPDFHDYESSPKQFGFHFGPQGQANARIDNAVNAGIMAERGTNIKPVYLSIKNPLRLPDIARWEPHEVARTLEELYPNDYKGLQDELIQFEIEGSPFYKEEYDYDTEAMEDDQTDYVRKKIQETGYDGIVYSNQYEDVDQQGLTMFQRTTKSLDKFGEDSYIAFEPEQIKSVFNTDFDAGSPTFQLEPGVNTKTPAFKKWFGKSILKNEDGSPMVVFHGTSKSRREMANINVESNDFTSFEPNQDVMWFGNNTIANLYAFGPFGTKDGSVYPVYLKAENPKIVDSGIVNGDTRVTRLEAEDILGVDLSEISEADDGDNFYQFANASETVRQLKEQGYDSIVMNEGRFYDYSTMGVFEPTQIKSAYNQGTFDESDPNISYQLEPGVVDKAVGLYPDVLADKKKSDRLRLTVDRRKKDPTVGRQKNNRVEFELENGGVMILGRDKTPQDWIRQVESVLDESEVISAMNWYEEAYPSFVEEFGEDQAIPYMVAWLLGNVQASPQQALSNTFLGAEQLKAELPSFKSAGTGPVAKNIKDVLQGKRAEKGAGAKLYDFLDSALGKGTRTIMQDDKRGLAPVAIDRHTFRDAGFADAIIKNILKRLAIDKDRVKRLRYDTRGSAPSDTQYEYALEYMNNLTRELNQLGYMGGNLKPHQVQAIGWTAIARMSESSDGQSIPDAMRLQQPTLAYEVEFGNNTPYAQKYGPAWSKLPSSEQIKVTDDINKNIVSNLAKELGLTIKSTSTKALGFWADESAPNATINVRGSSQAIKGLMNSLGYILQQDEIGLINKSPKNKGLGLVYSHPELSNPDTQQAVYDIIREATDDKITPGGLFQIVDGTPSIIVSTFINQDNANDYKDDIAMALENVRTELGMELTLNKFGSNYESTKNNWKQNSDGQRYRDKISETHKHDLLDRLDNHYRPQVEQSIESALKRNSEQQRKTRQLVPDPDLAAEINAAEQVDKSLELSDATISDRLKEFIFDTMHPLVSWQGDIQSQFLGDARIRDHQNVTLASELFVGKVPEIIRDINKDIIDSDNPESFISRLVNAGISTEDFNLYLHALHANERNDHVAKNNEELQDGGSGMTNSQAKSLKRELNKKYGLKKLRTFVKEFREKVIDASLDKRLEAGLIDQESYDRLKATYKNYVPLFRVMDNKQAILEESKSKVGMFDVKGPEFKKSRGSTREVQNILVSAVEQLHSAVVRSEKNLVNKRLLSLVESYPSESFEVVGVPHRPVYDKDGEIDYMVPIEGVRDNEDYIHVKVDGQTKRIIFKGEQGLRIANAMKGLGVSSGSKYLYAFNNYLRYVNTIANPEFIVTNFVRDVQTAGVNIGAEQGSAVLFQALSPKNLKNSWKAVFNVVRGADTESEWAELYERMRRAGGKTGFFDYESISDKLSKLEKDLQRVEDKGIGVKSAGKSILNFVENLNDATESAVRLTLFKAMLDNGYSEEQAASGAKNVTINFNRKGQIGGWLNSLYLFSNAGLQGSYRIFGVLKNSKGARRAVAGLAALGVTESIFNNMASEDDDEYEKLSDFEKDNYYIMRYGPGDKYFKMRLPYGYNVFKVVGNIAGDIAWNQMQGKPIEMDRQMARFLGAVNASFNPLGSGPFEQMIVPTIAEPILQLGTNKTFYGGPLKPENPYGPEKAEIEKYWGKTPDVYKKSAQYWFKLTGGKIRYDKNGEIDHAVRGWGGWLGDWSPETLEWWVNYLGGGLGQTTIRSLNTVGGIVTGEADFSKAPFLRQFYGEFKKDSEKRALYYYEKQMGRKLFDSATRLKYHTYLKSFRDKGNLTQKEYEQRNKKFIKAQKEAINLMKSK